MNATATQKALTPWRPIYWEPVADTGERLMVGVVFCFAGEFRGVRTIKKDVLGCLYGAKSKGLLNLIDESLKAFESVAQALNGLEDVQHQVFGLMPGELRRTEASNAKDVLEIACLMFSSLSNLEKIEESLEDEPQIERAAQQFGTSVRAEVERRRPDLTKNFGATAQIIPSGKPVKFGFRSERIILHFAVMKPGSTYRDAHGKIFELQQARELSGISSGALLTAVPREDDATLTDKQLQQARENQNEIKRELNALNLDWYAVHTVPEAADQVIALA